MTQHQYPKRGELIHGGYFEFDRPLPLVCIHDSSTRQQLGDRSLEILAQGAPNHVIAKSAAALREAESELNALIERSLTEFDACALIELVSGQLVVDRNPCDAVCPVVLVRPYSNALLESDAFAAFEAELTHRRMRGLQPKVGAGKPTTKSNLLGRFQQPGLCRLVLELDPVFYSDERTALRGLLLRDFAERLQPALRQLSWQLLPKKRRQQIQSASALGRRHISVTVAAIERELARISSTFSLLLQLTPTNGEQACDRFIASGCERLPEFNYRTIDVDPDELKRSIYQLRIEEVRDPAMARLLRDQRQHIDSELSMLAHRNSSKCLYNSLQVYGSVEDKLYRVARGILEAFGPDVSPETGPLVDAQGFRMRVLSEFAYYKKQDPRFTANVEVRTDVNSLTVADGTLYVPEATMLSELRAEALLAHEVGTHLLTMHNGKSQPLELMSTGLAGYEQLQEGLAVVSEYLAGGLTPKRLRLLAARVIAVRHLLNGGDFIEVYREMHKTLGLLARHAFFVTMRVFRGGGFTKDAIYLRGVLDVLDHLQHHPFELLLLGKFAAIQTSLMQELRWRRVLNPPALLPRVLKTKLGKRRLAALIMGPRTVFDLCQREAA